MKISLLIPSRNNLEFLKLCYSSIRKNQGNHFVEILVLDDKSDKDNTWEWCLEIMQHDPNFKAFKNNRKERLGISGGFKFLSQQTTQDVIGHFHADMFMVEGTLDMVERYLFSSGIFEGKYDKVVCLTRIEPPIYDQPGLYPEKIIWKDAPIEIEDWDEQKFLDFLPVAKKMWNGKTTSGHFVPFFMFREEYLKLGGNDIDNFPKQAREDSDWAFRLVLAGFETIQIPTFVYHFASRGNRRAKDNSGTWQDSLEWQQIDQKSIRNFIRKWGSFNPLHDVELKPRRPYRFEKTFKVRYSDDNFIDLIEPWCDYLDCDLDLERIEMYIASEQDNTPVNLESKFFHKPDNSDIIVDIDVRTFNTTDWQHIQYLNDIINETGEIGEFELGNLKIKINAMNHYEQDLIICKNEPILLDA